MDDILRKLPRTITTKEGRAWLTFGTTDEGWGVAYAYYDGYPVNNLSFSGRTVAECIDLMKQELDFRQLLLAPTVEGEPGERSV